VEIVASPLETHVAGLAAESIDAIVLVNVLEHIADDGSALSVLVRALKPGGHLLLFVPALQLLMSKLDRQLGHFRRYHKRELHAKVTAAGASVEVCRYMDLFGALPWFALNTILGITRFDPVMVGVNDRYAVPVSRWVERKIGAPVGKNLLLIARK
jgi:SAM-dependent methyltransferase